MRDKDFIHWRLWRFSIDWFTDCNDWFLYLRYRKPHRSLRTKVREIRFSSAGYMNVYYYESNSDLFRKEK
jgi:hypothetical protein